MSRNGLHFFFNELLKLRLILRNFAQGLFLQSFYVDLPFKEWRTHVNFSYRNIKIPINKHCPARFGFPVIGYHNSHFYIVLDDGSKLPVQVLKFHGKGSSCRVSFDVFDFSYFVVGIVSSRLRDGLVFDYSTDCWTRWVLAGHTRFEFIDFLLFM